MVLRKVIVLSALFSVLGAFSGGCQSGGVGDPCTPEDEYQPSFSGFAAKEMNIESRSFQCETRVCLVNHFRGRVSCPLGQDANLAKKAETYASARAKDGSVTLTTSGISAPEAEQLCPIPGSSGEKAEVVTASVSPQCASRPASKAVYCSCRCDGPDKDARYCDCPSGFVCTPLPELQLGATVAKGSGNLTGSYCVKRDDVDESNPKNPVLKPLGACTDDPNPADKCDKSGNCDGITKNRN